MYDPITFFDSVRDAQAAVIKTFVKHEGFQDALLELVEHQALFSKSIARISERIKDESVGASLGFHKSFIFPRKG